MNTYYADKSKKPKKEKKERVETQNTERKRGNPIPKEGEKNDKGKERLWGRQRGFRCC